MIGRAVSPLRFYIARLLRDEAVLSALSVSQVDLLAALQGRTVALIGNARALAESTYGQQIDNSDLIIRINRAPVPSPVSHGSRTDWLALAVRLSDTDRERVGADRILWMSPKRKRLDWHSANSPGFYLHPLADYRRLKNQLAAPPTTGAMMIALLLCSDLARLTLYGFDFFASQSLSGSRTARQVPHDFRAEANWVNSLAKHDDRLVLAPAAEVG